MRGNLRTETKLDRLGEMMNAVRDILDKIDRNKSKENLDISKSGDWFEFFDNISEKEGYYWTTEELKLISDFMIARTFYDTCEE